MGHRARIANERPDCLYNLHYAHWDTLHPRLKHEITAHYRNGVLEVPLLILDARLRRTEIEVGAEQRTRKAPLTPCKIRALYSARPPKPIIY